MTEHSSIAEPPASPCDRCGEPAESNVTCGEETWCPRCVADEDLAETCVIREHLARHGQAAWWRLVRGYLLPLCLTGVLIVALLTGLLFCVMPDLFWASASTWAVNWAMVLVPTGVLCSVAGEYRLRRGFPRTVELRRDTLIVTSGADVRVVSLVGCQWFVGTSLQAEDGFGLAPFECVVVMFRPGERGRWTGLWCGRDPEMRRVWELALGRSSARRVCYSHGVVEQGVFIAMLGLGVAGVLFLARATFVRFGFVAALFALVAGCLVAGYCISTAYSAMYPDDAR